MIREFTDSLGRPIRLPWPPQRVVSLVASQTETLVLLGLPQAMYWKKQHVDPRVAPQHYSKYV